MVDINTAMAAAAAERRNRGTGDKERKKNRSGADMGIESFDPVKHVSKEKADTISMRRNVKANHVNICRNDALNQVPLV